MLAALPPQRGMLAASSRQPHTAGIAAAHWHVTTVQLLVGSFNVGAAEGLMCRDTISVGWDGRVYDCDFNQQLELGLRWGLSSASMHCSAANH